MYSCLKVAPYKFADDKTGEIIEGCKVTLMDLNPTSQRDAVGCDVSTENIQYSYGIDFINSLPEGVKFPVLVDISVEMTLGKKPKVTNIKYRDK